MRRGRSRREQIAPCIGTSKTSTPKPRSVATSRMSIVRRERMKLSKYWRAGHRCRDETLEQLLLAASTMAKPTPDAAPIRFMPSSRESRNRRRDPHSRTVPTCDPRPDRRARVRCNASSTSSRAVRDRAGVVIAERHCASGTVLDEQRDVAVRERPLPAVLSSTSGVSAASACSAARSAAVSGAGDDADLQHLPAAGRGKRRPDRAARRIGKMKDQKTASGSRRNFAVTDERTGRASAR